MQRIKDGSRERELLGEIELHRKVLGILNKLTCQNFKTVVEQFKNLDINTEEKLNGVIDLVFEKAIDEPNFSVLYANMCKHLALIRLPLEGQPGDQVQFRKLLITKCQKEFEQGRYYELRCEERIKAMETADPEKRKELQLEFEEEEKKMRNRQLGNIRFIGELFKLNMLIEPIMHEGIQKLLSQSDEKSLECLCCLLKTIGKELDEKGSKNPEKLNPMDKYFDQMQKIVDKRLTSSKISLMLQDVIDLKKSNWIPRRDESNPKTIDQMYKEAECEAREAQQIYQNLPYSNRPLDDRCKISSKKKTKKTKKKIKNILKNGESKEGEDMDAFLDKVEELPPASAPVPTTIAPVSDCTPPASNTKAPSPVPILDSKILSTIPLPGETVSKDSNAQTKIVLKYDYKEDQWSPLNPEGKKQYDRDFLLQLQCQPMSLCKPSNLPNLDIIKHKAHIHRLPEVNRAPAIPMPPVRGCFDPFMPNYVGNKLKPHRKRQSRRGDKKEKIIMLPMSQNIKLHESENALKPSHEVAEEHTADETAEIQAHIQRLTEVNRAAPAMPMPVRSFDPFMPNYVRGGNTLRPPNPAVSRSQSERGDKKQKIIVLPMNQNIKLHESENALKPSDKVAGEHTTDETAEIQKLEFTVSQNMVIPNSDISIEEIKTKLKELLTTYGENEAVFDWIDAKVPPEPKVHQSEPSFIRALSQEVYKASIIDVGGKYELDQAVLKKRLPLLARYIGHNETLELQVLYAVQHLMNDLNQPKGVLKQIFEMLYDDDVITEETFKVWEQSKDPSELEGKDVALLSLRGFFKWLREASSGEDLDDE